MWNFVVECIFRSCKLFTLTMKTLSYINISNVRMIYEKYAYNIEKWPASLLSICIIIKFVFYKFINFFIWCLNMWKMCMDPFLKNHKSNCFHFTTRKQADFSVICDKLIHHNFVWWIFVIFFSIGNVRWKFHREFSNDIILSEIISGVRNNLKSSMDYPSKIIINL